MKMLFASFISALVVLTCGTRQANSVPLSAQPEAFVEQDFQADESVLAWDKTVHDFGDVSVSDGPLSCTFTLTNKGSASISIFEVVSSCGCTDVKWTKGSIAPGEKGTITATYKNEDGPRPFDKTLTVYISGVKRPVVLRLRGVVHDRKKSLSELFGAQKLGAFGLKTRSLKAPALKQGLSVSESLTVANLDKKPLKVEWADVTPGLSLQLSANPIPAGTTATLSYTVESAPRVYGKHIYSAAPVLNGRKADGLIEITAWTQENFAGMSEDERKAAALPYFDQSTYTFGSVQNGTTVEAVFPCTNRGKSPFHVFQADADVTLKAVTPDIAPGAKETCRFSLNTRDLPKGDAVIMVSLTTNSPLRPVVNLFITGIIE